MDETMIESKRRLNIIRVELDISDPAILNKVYLSHDLVPSDWSRIAWGRIARPVLVFRPGGPYAYYNIRYGAGP